MRRDGGGKKEEEREGRKNLSQVEGMNLRGENMYFKYSAIVTSLISRPPPCLALLPGPFISRPPPCLALLPGPFISRPPPCLALFPGPFISRPLALLPGPFTLKKEVKSGNE